MLVVSTAALGGLTVLAAPVASAAPAPAALASARPHCKPAHGRDFRWDDRQRGGHWDRVIKNRRGKVVDVKHLWWEKNFCASRHDRDRDRDRGRDR